MVKFHHQALRQPARWSPCLTNFLMYIVRELGTKVGFSSKFPLIGWHALLSNSTEAVALGAPSPKVILDFGLPAPQRVPAVFSTKTLKCCIFRCSVVMWRMTAWMHVSLFG
jgi:hypothetical protein